MCKLLITLAALVWLIGCGSSDSPAERPVQFGGDRPADLEVPSGFTDDKTYPLVMVLHGFGANGFAQAAYFGASALPGMDQAFVIAPDGTPNSQGRQFWNADPACCDFEGQGPDDVAYLGGIVDDVTRGWPIDRVYVVGHSNGGFMAYRLACERADALSAIVSLAGLASSNPAGCTPSRSVPVLHVHGTSDAVIPFGSGAIGADASVDQWAGKNGCAGTTRGAGTTYDLDNQVAGAETRTAPIEGCPVGGELELWRMEGSSHVPLLGSAFTPRMMEWLTAHGRAR